LQNQDRVLVLEVVVEICSGDETVFEAVEEVLAKRASIGPLNFPFGIVDDCPDLTVNQGAMDLNERSILLVCAAVASGLPRLRVGSAKESSSALRSPIQ
jgi:hypothetical protein